LPKIAWTSLSLKDSSGSTKTLTPAKFSESVILDTGTSVTSLPIDLYLDIANATMPDMGWVNFPCSALTSSNVTVNFGFGSPNVPVIPVRVSEFALPSLDQQGKQMTSPDGSPGCNLGIFPMNDTSFVFGETFLRSAYVVYNFDHNQISIAPTRLTSGEEKVVEIKGGGPGSSSGATATGSKGVSAPKTSEGAGIHGAGRGYLHVLIALVALVVGGLQ
jgi:hypothetical protein